MDFSFGYLVNQALYALSGFFFGTFCCRMGVLTCRHMYNIWQNGSIASKALRIPVYLAIVFCLWGIFPLILHEYTAVGGFTMLATIMYFSNYARKIGSFKQSPQQDAEKLLVTKGQDSKWNKR